MIHYEPTSEEIKEIITTRAQSFLDIYVPYDELVCEVENESEESETILFKYALGTAEFTPHAFRQLLARVQLSINYWRRLEGWRAYNLMADNYNFCNESTANEIAQQPRANDPTYLFRLRLDPSTIATINQEVDEISSTEAEVVAQEGEEPLLTNENNNEEQDLVTPVRAVLSSNYTTFDDNVLFPMLIDELESDENIQYKLYEYDQMITRLHIRFRDRTAEHDMVQYSAGMVITNSEVGISSVWIEPVVYRAGVLYTNRGTLTKQDVKLKIVHRGEIDRQRISEALSNCSTIAQVGIVQLAEAFEKKIDPKHASILMENIVEFPSRMVQILNEEWEHEEDLKQAEVASAILQMAQTLPLFQRIKIEQAAGKIIGLFDRYETRLARIIEELEE